MSKRFTFDYVKEYIEVTSGSGYQLLSTEYAGNYSPITIKCNEGHVYSSKFAVFKNLGGRCPFCYGNIKYTIDQVRRYVESESASGYRLISTQYVNNRTPLEMVCDKGHEISMTFTNFKRGRRCWVCRNINLRGENHTNYKGGLTALNKMLRASLDQWKIRSFESTNYRCDVTGNRGILEVHHLYPFHKVVREILNDLQLTERTLISEYSREELDLIKERFLGYHESNLGKPLLPKIHKLYHKIYGYENNEQQYEEFKKLYAQGEVA